MSGRHHLTAEFADADAVCAAARKMRAHTGLRIRAYTPYAVPELAGLVDRTPAYLPQAVLAGGIVGALLGAALQYLPSSRFYPINVGGRPLASWPAFGPILFELAVAGAMIGGVVAFIAVTRLPRLYHPVFATPDFLRASQDRFFLDIAFDSTRDSPARLRKLLAECHPRVVHEREDDDVA